MRPISEYQVIVFDCDGVILDSNQLKIEAMARALHQHCAAQPESVAACVEYFSSNFGKSRYHHVKHFADNILDVESHQRPVLHDNILASYSSQCLELYMKASITPGLLDLIEFSNATKYVASGSDQEELRQVFSARGLEQHFAEIMGSPNKKADLVGAISENHKGARTLMIGDAVSDFQAAAAHGVDFLFYAPFSNVASTMLELSKVEGFAVCDDFRALLPKSGGLLHHGQ